MEPMYIWPTEPTKVLRIVPIICFAYQVNHKFLLYEVAFLFYIYNLINLCSTESYYCHSYLYLYEGSKYPKVYILCCDKYVSLLRGIHCRWNIWICYLWYWSSSQWYPTRLFWQKCNLDNCHTISVAVKSFVTYPIVLYCGRDAVLNLFGSEDYRFKTFFILTMVWFTSSLLVAIVVPDISPLISLMGILSAAFIFVFPGLFLLNKILQRNQPILKTKEKSLIFLAIFIAALGAFASGVIAVEGWKDLKKTAIQQTLLKNVKYQLGESLCK